MKGDRPLRRVLVHFEGSLRLSKKPFRAASNYSGLPVVVEAYHTPLFMNEILTLFCGVDCAYGRFTMSFVLFLCPSTFSVRRFPLTISLDDLRSVNEKESENSLVKGYRAVAN